jgi:hypothetical protein
MANGDLHPCKECGGDGFHVEWCGCREAMCPHEPFCREADIDERPGLYRKFWVRRTDGSSGEKGKHALCEYLVLDWNHDRFAVAAGRAYADACEAEYPELAADIRQRAGKAEARWKRADRKGENDAPVAK